MVSTNRRSSATDVALEITFILVCFFYCCLFQNRKSTTKILSFSSDKNERYGTSTVHSELSDLLWPSSVVVLVPIVRYTVPASHAPSVVWWGLWAQSTEPRRGRGACPVPVSGSFHENQNSFHSLFTLVWMWVEYSYSLFQKNQKPEFLCFLSF